MSSLRPLQIAMPLLAMVLGACNDDFTSTQCSIRTTIGNAITPFVAFDQQATTVPLSLPPPFACPNGNPIAKSATTEVLDPSNLPVAHTASAPSTDDSSGYTTNITFTPQIWGSYYLSASFEPSIGAQHRDVTVAENHTADLPFIDQVTVPSGCRPTVVTPVLVLCHIGSTVFVIRPAEGMTAQITDAPSALYAAPTLWVWGTQSVTRYEDTGVGAFVEKEHLLATASTTAAAAASATTLALFAGSSVDRYTAANGSLTSTTTALTGIDVAPGSQAVFVSDDHFGVFTSASKVCDVGLSTGTATCVAVAATSFEHEGSGFWATLVDRTQYFSFSNGAPTSNTLLFTLTGSPVSRGSGSPFFEFAQGYLTLHAGDFRPDAYPKLQPLSDWQVGVTGDALWYVNDSQNIVRGYHRS